jgi:hypothetical protein
VPSVGRVFSGALTLKGLGLWLRGFDSLAETTSDTVVTSESDKPTEK